MKLLAGTTALSPCSCSCSCSCLFRHVTAALSSSLPPPANRYLPPSSSLRLLFCSSLVSRVSSSLSISISPRSACTYIIEINRIQPTTNNQTTPNVCINQSMHRNVSSIYREQRPTCAPRAAHSGFSLAPPLLSRNGDGGAPKSLLCVPPSDSEPRPRRGQSARVRTSVSATTRFSPSSWRLSTPYHSATHASPHTTREPRQPRQPRPRAIAAFGGVPHAMNTNTTSTPSTKATGSGRPIRPNSRCYDSCARSLACWE